MATARHHLNIMCILPMRLPVTGVPIRVQDLHKYCQRGSYLREWSYLREGSYLREKQVFFKQETNQPNKKYCPTYIISYELSPREEIILEHSLKGKSECVPTTPKIFQSTGIPFLVI